MTRRSPGEGSVFQRRNGMWVVQIELEDGKRKTYYVKSKKEGREKLKQLQQDMEQGMLATGPQQTVKQYLEYWLEEVHRHHARGLCIGKVEETSHSPIGRKVTNRFSLGRPQSGVHRFERGLL